MANRVNGVSGALAPAQIKWYFGGEERLDPGVFLPFLRRFTECILNPLTTALCVGGVLWAARTRRRSGATLFLGWFAGCVISLLLFPNLHRRHVYYQLPFVIVVMYFASLALDELGRYLVVRLSRIPTASVAVVAGALWLCAVSLDQSLTTNLWFTNNNPADEKIAAGRTIRAQVRDGDFVLYVVPDYEGWNPQFLYHARREGANLKVGSLQRGRVRRLLRRHGEDVERLLVFCPESLEEVARAGLDDLGELTLLDRSAEGTLFQLQGFGGSPAPSGARK